MIYIKKKNPRSARSAVCMVCVLAWPFLRRHLAGKLVVASPNVGCFLRLTNTEIWSLEEKKKEKETVKVSKNKEKRYTKLCLQKQK